jgi:hypothetical protein
VHVHLFLLGKEDWDQNWAAKAWPTDCFVVSPKPCKPVWIRLQLSDRESVSSHEKKLFSVDTLLQSNRSFTNFVIIIFALPDYQRQMIQSHLKVARALA